jgi:hypothetical protein
MWQANLTMHLRSKATDDEGIINNDDSLGNNIDNYNDNSIIGDDTDIYDSGDKLVGCADEGMDEDVDMAD